MWPAKLKGLTLVEVLVAVTISLILLGVSIPLFTKNAKKQDLKNEAEAVAAFYQRARNYAFNPERINVESYRVSGLECVGRVCDGLGLYAIVAGADPAEVDILPTPNINIEIPADIGFKAGDGKSDGATSRSIRVYFKDKPGQKIRIEINSIGNIDVIEN